MIKISLTIKDNKVKLTFDEARKLYEELNIFFGKKDKIPVTPQFVDLPMPFQEAQRII